MRRSAVPVVLLVLVGLAVPASAGATLQVSSGSSSLVVVGDGSVDRVRVLLEAQDGSTYDDSRAPNEQGVPVHWRVECGALEDCIDVGSGCQGIGIPGLRVSTAICDRPPTGGVTLRMGGGGDDVRLRIGPDSASVELGAGADTLSQNTLGTQNSSSAFSSGLWTVDGGAGSDTIDGSVGANSVNAGDGNDTIRGWPQERLRDAEGRELVFDNPDRSGNDSLNGGPGNDTIDPGIGSDVVVGGPGNDTFRAGDESRVNGQRGDAYDGGSGTDVLDYSRRTSNLFFNSGATESGPTGVSGAQRDRVSRTENVNLGSGNDFVLSLLETLATRRYDGGAGDDRLNGASSSRDTLIGGPGADRMHGFGGNDTIRARDGIADTTISCGAGTDFAEVDLRDPSPPRVSSRGSPRLRTDCETLTRRAVNEADVVRIAAARAASGALLVRLFCPRTNDRRCAGRLDAASAARRYSIRRGAAGVVELDLSAREATGVARGRPIDVRSVEAGRFGPKTVIRTLVPRR